MKKKSFSITILFLSLFAHAQVPVFQWAKSMGGGSGDFGYSLVVDEFGSVYTTGCFRGVADFDPGTGIANLTSGGYNDIFISKLDSSGNFLWVKQIGGASEDIVQSIALDKAGNVYTTGYFLGTLDFDPSAGVLNLISNGQNDVFISKLDSSGNFVWAKNIGGTLNDYGASIVVDGSANVYTTGYFMGIIDSDPDTTVFNLTSAGTNDIFISKLDFSGNFVWGRQMGGTSSDFATSMTLGAFNAIYITGRFQGTADFDPGAGISNLTTTSFPANQDAFISKIDLSGNFVWVKQLGGTSNENGYSIASDTADNVYTTGTFGGTVDFNPGPTAYYMTSAGGDDAFISKLDASGNFVFAKNMGGLSYDFGRTTVVDDLGNSYTTGWLLGTEDFDPSAGIFNLSSIGGCDIFISKLDPLGNFIWAKNIGGTLFDNGQSIALDENSNVYVTGHYSNIADFDIGAATYNLTSVGMEDIFVLKMTQTSISVGVTGNINTENVFIYPNPSSGKFQINFDNTILKNSEIRIFNTLGVNIRNVHSNLNDINFDISDQPKGIYFVEIKTGDERITKKILLN